MQAIWQAAVEELDLGKEFALATIVAVRGSSPRHVGTRLLIRRDGTIVGTIGGGLFEADVQAAAGQALEQGVSQRVSFSFRGDDSQSPEMICGGDTDVLIEVVNPLNEQVAGALRATRDAVTERRPATLITCTVAAENQALAIHHLLAFDSGTVAGGFENDHQALLSLPEPRLLSPVQLIQAQAWDYPLLVERLRPSGTVYIFGAGHVGECVAHLARYVDFHIVVLDDRSEFASPERVPDAHSVIVLDSFDHAFTDLPVDDDAYVVIVTRGHTHDKTVLKQALASEAGYVGMIGSRRKTRLIFDALVSEGTPQESIDRVHAPIGLPIGGETPREIAVSIVAEMLLHRTKCRGEPKGRACPA